MNKQYHFKRSFYYEAERTYMDFLFHIKDFYDDFMGTKEYLRGCMDDAMYASLMKAMSCYDCKTAMQFLSNCGLTTLTYISDEWSVDPYITAKFLKDTNELYLKPQMFSKFHLTIDYPMFCIDLIQSMLNDREISELPKELLENIVECHVRSLLPQTGIFKYQSDTGTEIAYVVNAGYGIEIDVADVGIREVNIYDNSDGKELVKQPMQNLTLK